MTQVHALALLSIEKILSSYSHLSENLKFSINVVTVNKETDIESITSWKEQLKR